MLFPSLESLQTRPAFSTTASVARPDIHTVFKHRLWLPDTDPDQGDPHGLLYVQTHVTKDQNVSFYAGGRSAAHYHTAADLYHLSQIGFRPGLEALGIDVAHEAQPLGTIDGKTTYTSRYMVRFPTAKQAAARANGALGGAQAPDFHFVAVAPGHFSAEEYAGCIAVGGFPLSQEITTPVEPVDEQDDASHDILVHAAAAMAVAKTDVFGRLSLRAARTTAGLDPDDTLRRFARHTDLGVNIFTLTDIIDGIDVGRYSLQDVVGQVPKNHNLDDYMQQITAHVADPYTSGLLMRP